MNFTNPRRQFFSALSVFPIGAFLLRYLMRKNELLSNGSIAEGAVIYRILPIVCVLFALGTVALFWRSERHTEWSGSCSSTVIPALIFTAAVLLGIGNILLWYNGQTPVALYVASAPEFAAFLSDLLPPLGLISAVCMGAFALRCHQRRSPSALLYMCVSLYLTVRLIVCFQIWNTDPSIHDYCYALLANISAMLATFHIAGFSLDKGKYRMCMFCLMCTSLFSAITVADGLYDGNAADVLVHGALFLAALAHCLQLLSSYKKTQCKTFRAEE